MLRKEPSKPFMRDYSADFWNSLAQMKEILRVKIELYVIYYRHG